jgi:hypothetical protein
VCRITGAGYLIGTPKEGDEAWQGEWFYISDVPLEGPSSAGTSPILTLSSKEAIQLASEESRDGVSEVARLAAQITCLGHNKLIGQCDGGGTCPRSPASSVTRPSFVEVQRDRRLDPGDSVWL